MTRSLYSGVIMAAVTVTVYWAGSTTKPTLYVGPSSGSTVSNPITADWEGNYSFWIDDGHYKIVNGSVAGDVTTVAAGPTQAAAAKVRVTTNGTPGAGAIRITTWYLTFAAPTS